MKQPKKYPTQKTIAEDLKISRTTVAEILGGKETHRYSEQTRQRVLEAAKRLHYRPHRSAQEMRRGRSNLIGVIHFGGAYEVSRQMRHYLAQAITEQGYDVSLAESSILTGTPQEHRTISHLLETRVEGVIIANAIESFGTQEIHLLKASGIPVVALASRKEWGIPTVYGDIQSIMERMVHHLVKLGHRRLLLLTNQYEALTTLHRIKGFTKGIIACGGHLGPCKDDLLYGEVVRLLPDRGSFDLASQAYHYMQHLIVEGDLPDVILCHNDHWARGVFSAAYEAGIRIPEDLAITGFDNESFGMYPPFELTTVTSPVALEAEKAVEMMIQLIQGHTLKQSQITLPCELLIRRSCGSSCTPKARHFSPA